MGYLILILVVAIGAALFLAYLQYKSNKDFNEQTIEGIKATKKHQFASEDLVDSIARTMEEMTDATVNAAHVQLHVPKGINVDMYTKLYERTMYMLDAFIELLCLSLGDGKVVITSKEFDGADVQALTIECELDEARIIMKLGVNQYHKDTIESEADIASWVEGEYADVVVDSRIFIDNTYCKEDCSTELMKTIREAIRNSTVRHKLPELSLDTGFYYSIKKELGCYGVERNRIKVLPVNDTVINSSYEPIKVQKGEASYSIPMAAVLHHISSNDFFGENVLVLAAQGFGKTTFMQYVMSMASNASVLMLTVNDVKGLVNQEIQGVLKSFLSHNEYPIIMVDEAQELLNTTDLAGIYDLMDGTISKINPNSRVIVGVNTTKDKLPPALIRAGRVNQEWIIELQPLSENKVLSLVNTLKGADKVVDVVKLESYLKGVDPTPVGTATLAQVTASVVTKEKNFGDYFRQYKV